MEGGSDPERRLLPRESFRSRVRFAKAEGMQPVSWLESRRRCSRRERRPRAGGMGPASCLRLLRSSNRREKRSPRAGERLPAMEASEMKSGPEKRPGRETLTTRPVAASQATPSHAEQQSVAESQERRRPEGSAVMPALKLAWVRTPHDGSGAADFNGTREERIGASLCPNGVLYILPSHLMSCRSRWASLAFACLSRVCTW
ncbi:unnamed protein product [Musa banksii]